MRILYLFGVLFCSTLSAQIPDPSLVAYYPFNGNADDHSSNNNHGTVYGASLTKDRFGRENQAYHFDGSTNYIDIGTDNSLKMEDAVTITTWINIDVPTLGARSWSNVISDHSPAHDDGKIFRFQGRSIEFLLGAEGSLEANYVFPDDASGWHHIATTYDGETIIIYVDGANVASALRQGTIVVNPNPLLIGKSGWGEYFIGDMDEFRIYNRALSAQEILGLIFKDSFED